MPKYSDTVILAWDIAADEVRKTGHSKIEPCHIFLGICKLCDLSLEEKAKDASPEVLEMLEKLKEQIGELQHHFDAAGLPWTVFRRNLRDQMKIDNVVKISLDDGVHRSEEGRRVFKRAREWAQPTGKPARATHVLIALLEIEDPPWAGLFEELTIEREKFLEAVQPDRRPVAVEDEAEPRGKSILKDCGRDLTKLAAHGELATVVGRNEEMKALARVLMQQRKNSAILVGEAGVGKTAVVEGLAQLMVQPEPPKGLGGRRIVEVTMAGLVAGTKYRGEFEKRMQALIRECAAEENLVLFIDEIHTMLGAGGEGSADAANILKPALARGEICCIGATTVDEYRKYIEKDAALERRFQVIPLEEPTRDQAVEIMAGIQPRLEEHHGVEIADEAITSSVDLSIRYLPDFRLPDKAIDLLDQACARARLKTFSLPAEPLQTAGETVIGSRNIAEVVAQRCRIPIEQLTATEAKRFMQMEEALRKRVMGQDEAVRVVCEAVRTARAGLKPEGRPVGTFLFAGGTGTGKTELAKALAEFLFGTESHLIRIDMSEYMEPHSVSRLVGAPPGYVGHDEEGQLTKAVRTQPYSVVLLDEVEKAHPRVLDLFLQVFSDGRLTDSRGRVVSFTETVIIMTSNLGASPQREGSPKKPLGFAEPPEEANKAETAQSQQRQREHVLVAVKQAFRPEFYNRINQTIIFNPLSPSTIRAIIDKMVGAVEERLKEKRMRIRLSEEAYAWLLERGYEPAYGAREMQRLVEQHIVQPLATELLNGAFQVGEAIHVVQVGRSLRLMNDDECAKTQEPGNRPVSGRTKTN